MQKSGKIKVNESYLPSALASGVVLLGGAGVLQLPPRTYFWERLRRKDFEGLMWLGGDTQVQQETPCDCGRMHEETAVIG